MTARLSPAEVLRSYRGVWLPAGRYIDLFERAYVQGTLFALPKYTRRPTLVEIEQTNLEVIGTCSICGMRPVRYVQTQECAACCRRRNRAIQRERA